MYIDLASQSRPSQSKIPVNDQIVLHPLQDGRPHFIAEYNVQQVRKLVLEMVQRLPANDFLKPYVKTILSLVFKLLEVRDQTSSF